jgi:hypothetical protein
MSLVAAATSSAAVVPRAGDYQGTVNGTPVNHGHNEGEGYFTVKVINGARKIVPYGPLAKILAPSYFKCHQLNASIEAPKIPVVAGAFSYSGVAPIAISGQTRVNRHIIFKGHWTSPNQLSGTTRVIGPGCDKTVKWKMKTPPPS